MHFALLVERKKIKLKTTQKPIRYIAEEKNHNNCFAIEPIKRNA